MAGDQGSASPQAAWGGIRGIARQGIADRKTVRRYVAAAQECALGPRSPEAALSEDLVGAIQKLALTLLNHLDGILAYCHHKVPFGVVEAIYGNLRALIRRGRGGTRITST